MDTHDRRAQGAHLRKIEAMNWQASPQTEEDLIAARDIYGNVNWRQVLERFF